MFKTSMLLHLVLFPTFLLFGEEKAEIDFAREILPILSDKCYACHGPDTKKKDLVRLDLEELAKKDLGDYHAIDPDDLEESELLYRIVDEDDPMPPEDLAKRYREEEKDSSANGYSGASTQIIGRLSRQPRKVEPKSIRSIISLAKILKSRAMILPRRQTGQPWPVGLL